MSEVAIINRLCGACLSETGIVALRGQCDQLVWVCPKCGYIELSSTDEDCTLRKPNDEELRDMLGNPVLGRQLRELLRKIRLGLLETPQTTQGTIADVLNESEGCSCPSCVAMGESSVEIVQDSPAATFPVDTSVERAAARRELRETQMVTLVVFVLGIILGVWAG